MNKPYSKSRNSYILNLIDSKKSDVLLNIGISNIPEMEILLENKVKACVTLDNDSKKLEKAKSFLKKTKLVDADIYKKPLEKNHFNKVIMLEVLEHLDNDESILEWIHSILKKSGVLVMSVPSNHFLHIINPVKYMQHKRHYSTKRLKRILKSAGFQIEHINLVENWSLLANLYIHLFRKYILRNTKNFLTFKKTPGNTYRQKNSSGLDIVVKARKI